MEPASNSQEAKLNQIDTLQIYETINKLCNKFYNGSIDSQSEFCEYFQNDKLTKALLKLDPAVCHYFRNFEYEFKQLELIVKGESIGTLFSLDIEKALKYCKRSSFGKGNETVYDETIRKALELKKEDIFLYKAKNKLISSSEFNWKNLITKSEELSNKLLPHGYELKIEFNKLCIYEKGGFFKTHKDTCKGLNHFGSLVLCLPSKHKGGELIIRTPDQKEEIIDFSQYSEDSIQYVAFYSDFEHEIQPVKSGYRVTLTFDLFFSYKGEKNKGTTDHPEEDSQYYFYNLHNSMYLPIREDRISENINNLSINEETKKKIIEAMDDISKEYNQIGILLTHRYPLLLSCQDESIYFNYLKGSDKLLYDTCSSHYNIKFVPLAYYFCYYPNEENLHDENSVTESFRAFKTSLKDREIDFKFIEPFPLFIKQFPPNALQLHYKSDYEYNGNETNVAEYVYYFSALVFTFKEETEEKQARKRSRGSESSGFTQKEELENIEETN